MQGIWEQVWGYFKASPKGGMLLLNLLRSDLCREFLGSWLVGSFLLSWKIFALSNISPKKERTAYKVGILNFLKAPFASEGSVYAE